MKSFLVGSLVAAAAFAAPASAATTLFTSTFEEETGTGWRVVDSTGVWTKEPDTAGIELQFGGTAGATRNPGPSNRVKVELDSHSNSGMFYTFLEDGIYSLDFFFSPRPGRPESTNGLLVLLNDAVKFQFAGDGGDTTNWSQAFVGPFSASKGDKLIFRAAGTSDSFGVYVDDITVRAVPEPGTWMLMILGLGAVGFAMRRRQKVATRISFA